MKTEEETEQNQKASDSAVFKPFLLGVIGVAVIMGIFVLLPMFFTYLSEGNIRPPSQIHPADPVGKSDKTVYEPLKSKK